MFKNIVKYTYVIANIVIALASIVITILEIGTGLQNTNIAMITIIAIIAIIESVNSYVLCVAVFDGNKKGR